MLGGQWWGWGENQLYIIQKKWGEKMGRNAPFIMLQNQPLKDRKLEMVGLGSLAKRQEQFSLTEVGMEGSREELTMNLEGLALWVSGFEGGGE